MSMIVEKKEKKFELFSAMLPELRMMVVNEMQSDDRCRFRRCSTLSNKEAMSSKNYIHKLIFIAFNEDYMWIKIQHSSVNNGSNPGLVIEFREEAAKKFIRYQGPNVEELWREELDESTDLVQYAANHFKQLLQQYRNSINNVRFDGTVLQNKLYSFDFGLGKLKNLKELQIRDDMDNILSQIKRPLKKLTIWGEDTNNRSLANCEQLYQVQNWLNLRQIELSYEQLLRLSTQNLYMCIGNLTEMDIFNFVTAWQNGHFGMEVKCYNWSFSRDPTFDMSKLFRMISGKVVSPSSSIYVDRDIELKNHKSSEIIARLFQWGDSLPTLVFKVKAVEQQPR